MVNMKMIKSSIKQMERAIDEGDLVRFAEELFFVSATLAGDNSLAEKKFKWNDNAGLICKNIKEAQAIADFFNAISKADPCSVDILREKNDEDEKSRKACVNIL